MAWSYGTIDWSATAAWAQALLSAVAIFASVRLADRSVARRELAARNAQLEASAALARWVWQSFDETSEGMADKIRGMHLADALKPSTVVAALNALQGFPATSLSDVKMLQAVLELRSALIHVRDAIERDIRMAGEKPGLYFNAKLDMERQAADLFGAAAKVERRVAEIVGRKPQL